MDDFSSCLPPPPSARALYASTPQRAAAARRNTQTFARAHESHFTRPLFHVRCVFKLSRGIENATNPRHKIPLSSSSLVLFEFFGGKHVVFSRLLRGEKKRFLSRNLPYRGVRDAPREEKNTQTESKECVSRNHRTPRAFTASRAHRIRARFRGIFFSSSSSRESEPSSSAPEFCSQKKGYKKNIEIRARFERCERAISK